MNELSLVIVSMASGMLAGAWLQSVRWIQVVDKLKAEQAKLVCDRAYFKSLYELTDHKAEALSEHVLQRRHGA